MASLNEGPFLISNLIACHNGVMCLYPYSFLPHSTLDQAISGENRCLRWAFDRIKP